VILYRCFAWNPRADADQPDSPLWFPRMFQGEGRHDNPDVYGCMYLADRPVSCVVEQLARFRSQKLAPSLLNRRGLTLGLAELELTAAARILDLDDPAFLSRQHLRPSSVATRERAVTQPQALKFYTEDPRAAGLSWWSAYEALWTNVTVFDRGAALLRVRSVHALTLDDPAVTDAARFFEMRTA